MFSSRHGRRRRRWRRRVAAAAQVIAAGAATTLPVTLIEAAEQVQQPVVAEPPAPTNAPATPSAPDPTQSGGSDQEPGKLVFDGSFEGDRPFAPYWFCQTKLYNDRCDQMGDSGYPLQIVPGEDGGQAARFEVRQGDSPPFPNGDRAQLVVSQTKETEGTHFVYDWKVKLGEDYPIVEDWQVLYQWHSLMDGSPPLLFTTWGDQLILQTRPNAFSSGEELSNIWSMPIVKGEWLTFRVEVKWSTDPGTGFVKLWKDGAAQQFQETPVHGNGTSCAGQTVCNFRNIYPGDAGNRLMVTYYRSYGIAQTGTVYHDGVKVYQP